MRISVINGSPKNDSTSATMQYIKYLQKRLPKAEFTILNVGNKIKLLENNIQEFEEIIKTITQSDGVIWGFPLYYLLVSSQMKQFIELIHERNATNAFRNKPAAIIATSIHFCDNIAINYMKEVSEDLGMNFFDYYSAYMLGLNNVKERARLTLFGANFLSFIQQGTINHRQSIPLVFDLPELKLPEKPGKTVTTDKKVVILTDEKESDKNLRQMTSYLKNLFGSKAEVVNLHDIKINGGCLGCIRCAYDFNCVYDGHDDYHNFYEAKVATADIIIYAGSIRDRYLSSKWKQFFDRSFFNNHTPMLVGKQIGMVISGPFRQMDNLNNLFHSYFELQKVNQAGVVSDDLQDSNVIEIGLINLAEKLVKLAAQEYVTPQTFLGVAGKKLFRDEIYGRMRFPFIKDYQSYKKLGSFDFPQKDIKTLLMNYVFIFFASFPKPRKFLYTKGIEFGVTRMYKQFVERAGAYHE